MRYFPIHLDLSRRKVLVVGGGEVAYQKIVGLLEAGGEVTVISPRFCPQVEQLIQEGRIRAVRRPYRTGDLAGFFLVFGATKLPELHRLLHEEARKRDVLLNAVDDPDECDFIIPARVERGDLMVTVSTSGRVPGFSKALRRSLEPLFGPLFEKFVAGMGQMRERMIREGKGGDLKKFFEENGEGLIEALKQGNLPEVNRILRESFGEGFSI